MTTPLVDSLVAPLGPFINGTALVSLKEEIDPETCELLGPFALAVQAVMGFVVLGSLLLKRAQEKPRRKWKVWLGDVGKQIFGQAFVHGSNVAISDLIARHKLDNPCSLYALNIFVDTTLGVLIVYLFLRLSTYILKHYSPTYQTGYYGNPFNFAVWARQAAVYVACLTCMKIVVLLLFWAFPVLFRFANWCLSFLSTDEAQVVAVMLVFPIIMNLFQFLIIDSILRSKDEPSLALMGNMEDEERGFLQDDEDEEDHEGYARHLNGATTDDSGYEGNSAFSSAKKNKAGDDSGIGTPTNRSIVEDPNQTPTMNRSTAYPPPRSSSPTSSVSSTSTRRTATQASGGPKRIIVPVVKQSSIIVPPERNGTPTIIIDEPREYNNGAAVNHGKRQDEEEDDWGDNSSISSSVSGEAAQNLDERPHDGDETNPELDKEIDELLADNEIWSEKAAINDDRIQKSSIELKTTSVVTSSAADDDEDANEWGL